MKMNKLKYFYILGLVALLSGVTSCDYGDINVDPTRPADVDLALILPAAQSQAGFNQMASANRLAGILMQHWDGFDAQQIDYMQYNIDENGLDNYWNTGLYGGVMKDCDVMIKKGVEQDQPHFVGIAKVLMAGALGQVACIFGDAPYSNAFLGTENLKPSYDSQEQLYASIQTLLDEAIVELAKDAVPGGPNAASDLIFSGDAAKWTATAHALKARYYMHLTKRDAAAHTKALGELELAFTSNNNQPDFEFDNAAAFANPLAQFGAQRPGTIIMNAGFVAKLAGDPRAGLIHAGDAFYNTGDSLLWSRNSSPSPLISYTEVKFLEAEAQLRAGQGEAANTALRAAITANMDYYGVDGEVYLGSVSDISGAALEAGLEVIMAESYKALYGQAAVEVWTNYRRTGYPALTPNPNGSNGNNPSGILPRRIIYPQNERVTNLESLNAAIANQGGALLDDDLWAFN
jgi:hypothetical protein